MPRPKKQDWERITITVSSEVAHALRIQSAETRREMGEVADEHLRRAGLVLTPKVPQPVPAIVPRIITQLPVTAGVGSVEITVAPELLKRLNHGGRLFVFLEELMKVTPKLFTHNQLMASMTPPSTGANFRTGWRFPGGGGHVPNKHLSSVIKFLNSLNIVIPKEVLSVPDGITVPLESYFKVIV